ncbi:MAG: M1 family aminopeptidase [Candidatus Acidiferrales bacterium]
MADGTKGTYLRKLVIIQTAALILVAAGIARAQSPTLKTFAFHAIHYEVETALHPSDQTITSRAKVNFVADAASRELVVELHEDLRVNSIKTANGQTVQFDRDANAPLLLKVNLPEAVAPGKEVALTFDYGGPISSEDDSPTKGVRFASVEKASAYLLLPARWFPLTNYPSNRYTGNFKIIVPDTFAVTGTGKSETPNPVPPGQLAYTFRCERPEAVGTFVAGNLQFTPAKVEGLTIPVFAPPAAGSTATAYGTEVVHIVNSFSDQFGPLQNPNLTVAQLADGSLPSFAAPGLLLVSARMWTAKPSTGMLAQLVASQWWGGAVLPASPSDVWLTDGLSRYSQALYLEQDEGSPGLNHALEDFAVGALMYESDAPIAQAQRLQPYSDSYRSVVVDKGAMAFHMLRAEMGNDAFHSLLHDFYAKYSGKTARVDDFEKMAEAKKPAAAAGKPAINLVSFFSQWLNSTGIPEFKLDYIVYRVKKGFKVVGKVSQDLETFQMPVEVRVDTEGNPEYKTISVTGTASEFSIDTFGRPKANGVTLDPNNNILKSSPKLRVRAGVARGEGLAADGKYYEAIQEYQHALDVQATNSLAHFRMGEAMFFQKNYQASANAFRSALDGDLDPKWIEVWSHIYLGKIFDVTGQRERAVNEYQRAEQLKDDTAGAQTEAAKYLQKPFSAESTSQPESKTPSK